MSERESESVKNCKQRGKRHGKDDDKIGTVFVMSDMLACLRSYVGVCVFVHLYGLYMYMHIYINFATREGSIKSYSQFSPLFCVL